MLVSLAFKLFTLAVGTWAVFFRRPRATLPRIQIYRALVCTLIVVFLTSFWLFYVRHLVRHNFGMNVGHKVEYRELVQFALNLVDSLLFVHYLAVLLMELRHKQSEYYVKVKEPINFYTSKLLSVKTFMNIEVFSSKLILFVFLGGKVTRW